MLSVEIVSGLSLQCQAGDMKAAAECYFCLERLVYQAAELASSDEAVRRIAVREGLQALGRSFSVEKVTIVVAAEIHDVIKRVTGNPDPYREMKKREIAAAKEVLAQLHVDEDNFRSCLEFAVLGNSMDFFRPVDEVRIAADQGVKFVIDDSTEFESKLWSARRLLYLADNVGEVFFDLPLVRWLRRRVSVVYAVKEAPVQNDVTLDDVGWMGLEAELGEIVTTGTATPGIDMASASAEFRKEFSNADLVLAKGMGYWESLSELPAEGRVLYCLRAKCQPVANSLGVSVGSYVAKLR